MSYYQEYRLIYKAKLSMKTYCFLVMVMLAAASVIFTACGNDDPVENKEGNDEKEVTITPLRNS